MGLRPLKPEEHEVKADRNEAFAADLETKGLTYEEWRVVVIFYGVLHRVDMFLTKRDSAVRRNPYVIYGHEKRNKFLEKHYPNIWLLYRPLYEDSRVARYGADWARTKWGATYFDDLRAVTLPALVKLLV